MQQILVYTEIKKAKLIYLPEAQNYMKMQFLWYYCIYLHSSSADLITPDMNRQRQRMNQWEGRKESSFSLTLMNRCEIGFLIMSVKCGMHVKS
jgi:hypothetical protein